MKKLKTWIFILVILLYIIPSNVHSLSADTTSIMLKIGVYSMTGNNIVLLTGSGFGVYIDNQFHQSGDIIAYPYGKHRITAIFPSGYIFNSWGASYDIEIANPLSANTTATFTGNLYVIQVIGGKAYASLYFIVSKIGSSYSSINITIEDAINNEAGKVFLPLEKIKIEAKLTINFPSTSYLGKGNLTINTLVKTSSLILKRLGSEVSSVDTIELNKTIQFTPSKSLIVNITIPEGNYELGLPNSTGYIYLSIFSNVKITIRTTFSTQNYTYSAFNSTEVKVMGVLPKVVNIYDTSDAYIVKFALQWADNSGMVIGKENVISLNLRGLSMSSPACDKNGYLNFTLNKGIIVNKLRALYGILNFYPQYYDGGLIPNSYAANLAWDTVASIVLTHDKNFVTIKLIRLSDFSPIPNSTVILLADNVPISYSLTDNQGYARLAIQANFQYNMLEIKVVLNSTNEILITGDYSNIILYYNSWP